MSTEQQVIEQPPALSSADIHNAVRNEHNKFFTLGEKDKGHPSREFPIKDLTYDDYMEFMDLAKPILKVLAETLDLKPADGDIEVEFNPASLDLDVLVKIAGDNLPRMAWICCRQSDPKITLAEVKRLGRRPWPMMSVILQQVKHNELVKEFADFFPQIAKDIAGLMPEVDQAMMPSRPTA